MTFRDSFTGPKAPAPPPRLALALLMAAALSMASACRQERHQDPAAATASGAVATIPAASTLASAPASHDPSHPPIDFPLRKAGIDPHGLGPFEDVEKYIAFLERPDRVAWQKPDAVVASLALTGSETVADVGAGSGYFTFRLAKALPHGRVVAIDIEPEMVRHIHHKAMSEGLTNVQANFATADDPKVPPDASVVFVCDVLHHVQNKAAWMGHMFAEAPDGARLVIIEFKEGDLPQGPPASVKMPRQQVVDLVTSAGFEKEAEDFTMLPYQYVLTFRKPAEGAAK